MVEVDYLSIHFFDICVLCVFSVLSHVWLGIENE
jgi:hypothetical protein